MDRLMRLVVAQGETIQTQLRRLNQRESQIENYEEQMHLLRVQSLGNDYLLSSYLHDQQNQHQQQQEPSAYPNTKNPPANQNFQYSNVQAQSVPPEVSNNLQSSQISSSHGACIAPPHEPFRNQIGNLHENLNDAIKNSTVNPKYNNNNVTRNPHLYNSRFNTSLNSEAIMEEKSNDSGVVVSEDSLGTSVEERTFSELEECPPDQVQEQLAFLSKLEHLLANLVHEEEKIQGLSSTIEILQTQQKMESAELEADLQRIAEEHSALVAEARANEQQIRVMDTSAAQKKKLIDALLQEEVDSDQETRALQAHLDYIIHLPPTAFRLPEEGDDPPPLPPPPVHPVCLVQSLLRNKRPQLVRETTPLLNTKNNTNNTRLTVNSLDSTRTANRHISPSRKLIHTRHASPQYRQSLHKTRTLSPNNRNAAITFLNRAPSPNILYRNRAPSPNIIHSEREPSPNVIRSGRPESPLNKTINRSCSPIHRNPLHPPLYDQVKFSKNITSNVKSLNPAGFNPKLNTNSSINNNCKDNTSSSVQSNPNNNTLKNMLSSSLPSLPNRTNVFNSINRDQHNDNCSNTNTLINSKSNINTLKTNVNEITDKLIRFEQINNNTDDETPPPLPLCPPPSLTPPLNVSSNSDNNKIKNKVIDSNFLKQSSLGNRRGITSVNGQIDNDFDDDNDSANTSSLCVSSRSSTSSENSAINSMSSASTSDSYLKSSKKFDNLSRISNPVSSSLKLNNHKENSISQEKSKSRKEADSADSNSDTGLSSLHSSSDEGGYALDTLV